MEKRVVFNNRVLPYLLLAPQIVITLVFFVVFIAKQISMDKELHEEMLDHTSEAVATPAE